MLLPFVLAWSYIVTEYYKKYPYDIGLYKNVSEYMQVKDLKNPLSRCLLENRRIIPLRLHRIPATVKLVKTLDFSM